MTDGLTSGALGPSPKHGGAPAEGEGCDAEWEGATHVGTWGLPRMKKSKPLLQLSSLLMVSPTFTFTVLVQTRRWRQTLSAFTGAMLDK